jgi:uncharacterized membrane protein YphA (DoxX/SURF4 family)
VVCVSRTMWILLRIAIGIILAAAGLGKLLSPYQNFQYVIQAYQIVPSWAETFVAQTFPWVELFIGAFLILGLWTRWAVAGALGSFSIFVVVVGQALVRGLPLENCGCFGELVHIKPQFVVALDSAGLAVNALLLAHITDAKKFGLDARFEGV